MIYVYAIRYDKWEMVGLFFFSVKLPRLKQIKRLNVFCVSDDHLSALMTRTRPARQSWIETAKPHMTDITK